MILLPNLLQKTLANRAIRPYSGLMGRHRLTGDRPYRLRQNKNRAIDVEFDMMPGKRISTKSWNMPDAIEFAESYLKKLGCIDVTATIPTLKEFASDFFTRRDQDSLYMHDKLYGHDISITRYEKCQDLLDNYILPQYGCMLVTAITARQIERWLPSIKPVQKNKKTLSNETRNKILVTFRLVMDEVKKLGYRTDNPAKDVKLMSANAQEREALSPEITSTLFPEDLEKRIEVFGSTMWAAYFSIIYDTGFRPGEVAALRVKDVWKTPKGYAVSTSRTVNRNEGCIKDRVKTTGKGYKERTGLVFDDTAALIMRLIKEKNLTADDLLFTAPQRKDGLLMPEVSNKHFKCVLKKYGLYHKGLVQYCFRHTHTTEIRGDVSDDVLAVSMGHTKLRDDYDHQKAQDLIRRLDTARDGFFEFRKRQDKAPDIIPISQIVDEK